MPHDLHEVLFVRYVEPTQKHGAMGVDPVHYGVLLLFEQANQLAETSLHRALGLEREHERCRHPRHL